jgi:L-threonylcarbamoyladenylate synthase
MTGPRVLDLRADPEADLTTVVAHVDADGVLAYPTETVYGLGGACTEVAASRVLALKPRAANKSLILLVESADSVSGLRWTPAARELASIFWPGAVTLVLEDPARIFPAGIRNEATGGVGVRVSPHPLVARFLRALGRPITSTSLNLAGEAPVSSGHEAKDVLRRMGAADAWLLDGGTLPPSRPSTVVDCTREEPTVLREGMVPIERLRCAIPEIHGRPDA